MVAGCEFRRSVDAHGRRDEVFVAVGVVHAAEERRHGHGGIFESVRILLRPEGHVGENIVDGHVRRQLVGFHLAQRRSLAHGLESGHDVDVVLFAVVLDVVGQRVRRAPAGHVLRGDLGHGLRSGLPRGVGQRAVVTLGFVIARQHAEIGAPGEVLGEFPCDGTVDVQFVAPLPFVVLLDELHGVVELALGLDVLVHPRNVLIRGAVSAFGFADGRAVAHGVLDLGRGVDRRAGSVDHRIGIIGRQVEPHVLEQIVVHLEVEVRAPVTRFEQHAVLVEVRGAQRETGLVRAARYREVMRLSPGRTAVHLRLGVAAGHPAVDVEIGRRAEVAGEGLGVLAAFERGQLVLHLHEFIGLHNVDHLRHVFHLREGVVGDRRFAGFGRFGGDDDDAVGAACAVDGCRGGVLQHVDRLDVVDRNVGDALHGESIDDIERRIVLRDGPSSAHAYLYICVGRSVGRGDLYAGHASGEGLGHVRNGRIREDPARNGGYGAREIAFGHRAVADDHDLIHRNDILFEDDGVDGFFLRKGHFTRGVSDEGDAQCLGVGRDFQIEDAVGARGGAGGRSLDHDGDAGHRLPGHGFHASGDVALRRCGLRMDTCRKKERQRQASQYPADMLGKVSLHRLAGLMFGSVAFCTGGSDP